MLSAVYEDEADERTTYGNKPQDRIHTARVYLENEPIRLMVEKRAAQAEADAAVWEQAAPESASGYASGALMTLFDSISLTPSGDTQDFAYEGLVIRREDAWAGGAYV